MSFGHRLSKDSAQTASQRPSAPLPQTEFKFEEDCDLHSGVSDLGQWLDRGWKKPPPVASVDRRGSISSLHGRHKPVSTSAAGHQLLRHRHATAASDNDISGVRGQQVGGVSGGGGGGSGGGVGDHNTLSSPAQLIFCLCLLHLLAGLTCLFVILCRKIFAPKVERVTDTDLALVTAAAGVLLMPFLYACIGLVYILCSEFVHDKRR